jgi:hypothetical protein
MLQLVRTVDRVTINLLGKSGSDGGIVWQWLDRRNYRAAVLDFGSRTVSILNVVDGHREVLATGTFQASRPGWLRLAAAFGAGSVTVYLDGCPISTARQAANDSGVVGFISSNHNAETLFDDIEIEFREHGRAAAPPAAGICRN